MFTNSKIPRVELGWLATTAAAYRDGFLPIHRTLHQEGLPILDEWGFLTPDLFWRHERGRGEAKLECLYALELLASTCQAAVDAGILEFGDTSATDVVQKIVSLQGSGGYLSESNSVCIFSPRIPNPLTRSAWLAALPILIPSPYRMRARRLFVEPALLLRTGYRILVNEWTAHGPSRPQTAEALAIFGLSALGLFPRWRCSLCFKLANPGASRCSLHGQPEVVRLSGKKIHSRNSAAARLGNRVMKKLNWSAEEFLNPYRIDTQVEQKTVAGILWGRQLGTGGFSTEYLQEEVARGNFPRLQKVLGNRFTRLNTARALALLRSKVDHNEWVVSSWYVRAFAAERWLEAAAELSPGRRQNQVAPKTLELVALAQTLINQGLSQKEAADRLNIKPPYLSRLLKRFPSL